MILKELFNLSYMDPDLEPFHESDPDPGAKMKWIKTEPDPDQKHWFNHKHFLFSYRCYMSGLQHDLQTRKLW